MQQVRTQDAFALEANLLGNSLGRAIVRIGHEIDALKPEFLERMPSEQSKGTRAGAVAPCRGRDPVTHRRAISMRIRTHSDAADDAPSELDGKGPMLGPHLATDERERVLARIRVWNGWDPARDLGVVAADDEYVGVVLDPGTQHEVSVPKFHQ